MKPHIKNANAKFEKLRSGNDVIFYFFYKYLCSRSILSNSVVRKTLSLKENKKKLENCLNNKKNENSILWKNCIVCASVFPSLLSNTNELTVMTTTRVIICRYYFHFSCKRQHAETSFEQRNMKKMKKNRTRRNSQPKTTKKKKKNEKKARAANIRVHEFEHFFFFVSVFLSFDEFLLWLPFEPHSFVCCLTLEIALKIRSQKKKKKNEKKVMVNN